MYIAVAAIFLLYEVLDPVRYSLLFVTLVFFIILLRCTEDLQSQLRAVLTHLMQILHQLDVACEDLRREALTFYQRGQVLARDPLEELLNLLDALCVILLPQF